LQVAIATNSIRRPDFWVGLDRQSRALYGAIAVSVVLHALVLAVHFRYPDAFRWNSANQPLEVVLVNAKTQEKPVHADVLAQANLDRGGNTDQHRHAKTPLPATRPRDPGKDLARAQRRVRRLEEQQRRLLAKATASRMTVAPETELKAPAEQPKPQLSGRDLADLSLAAMQLQAQIDRRIE
jgi:protein TonB